ncbi:carbonic anhydrase [Halteromyces radiatus]|uniref:carbonic anhydrase n=1 Tax=Halteromyces radiatus TaxID=101107 RepID=UPI00221E7E7C|nr:carbonic anhydrase [Halteromyces radiatus]KAI8089698.1 carbonic anhydrase [Halteromyces radiatus]
MSGLISFSLWRGTSLVNSRMTTIAFLQKRGFSHSMFLHHQNNNGDKPKEGLNTKFRRFFQPLSFSDPSNEKLRQQCECGMPSTVQRNKFDPKDSSLEGLLENNRQWAAAVIHEDPEFFKTIALQQEPKILWIGCSDSRVPANQIVQLGPGEIFVHRNIANVVNHADLNCLSVIQYAVEALKVEHIIVCGHYNCGGVTAALSNKSFGLIDNWLRSIKDVYRLHEAEFDDLKDEGQRIKKLVELNAINSAKNVCHSVVVQNAWKSGQPLTVHAWAYSIEDGRARKLDWVVSDNKKLHSIYKI